MRMRAFAEGLVLLTIISSLTACEPEVFKPKKPPKPDVKGSTSGDELLSGTIHKRILDQPTGSQTQYLLYTEDGQRIVLDFEADLGLYTGSIVEVSGGMIDVRTFAVNQIESLTLVPRRAAGPLVRKPTHHRVAILAVNGASVTEAEALKHMNAPVDSMQHFYNEVSHGIDTFSGDLFHRYDVDYTDTDCQYNNSATIADAAIHAFENDGYNADDYDHIAVVVPRSCGSDWSGAWGYVGGIADNGRLAFEQVTMYKDSAFDPWFLAHEIGHNIGLNHARSMDCGGSLYNPGGEGCSFDEYGNYNDVMGNGEGVYFSAAYQRYLGWIDATAIATAGHSDTFNLHPSDSDACGVRAVRIPIPDEEGSYFYVEYRHAREDSRYAGTGRFGSARRDAILITRAIDGGGGWDSTYTDRVEIGADRYDGIEKGKRYDLGKGVAVKVLSMGGDFAQVAIETPENRTHRDDNGDGISTAVDGSVGAQSCGGPVDLCPDDLNKTEPGICGCGVPEGTCAIITASGDFAAAGEGKEQAFDGRTDTKWLTFADSAWIQYDYPGDAKVIVGEYRITSANDHPDRDPRDFRLLGSNNGSDWSVLDTQSGVTFSSRFQTKAFAVPNTTAYAMYRLDILSNMDPPVASSTQLAELVLLEQTVFDDCPGDPQKTEPGICGCGVPDNDADQDGSYDCDEGCPSDPQKTEPGICGCGAAEGTCSPEEVLYEAEENTGASGCGFASGHPGFTGTGFMDYGGDGTWIEWNNVDVSVAGTYTLTFRYANGSAGNRQAAVLVNGAEIGDVSFPKTGAWTTWATDSIEASLPAGAGTIRVVADTGRGGPNLDHMIVTPSGINDDSCPDDSNKTVPGICGCGVADTDADGDGFADCVDDCPSDPNKSAPGSCGCGAADTDADKDGTADCLDRCPQDPDKTAPGVCGCGAADTDADKDGTADCLDDCPDDPDKTLPGKCGCSVPEGTCSGEAVTYEAEDRSSASGCSLASNHVGFTGSGFMDYGGQGTYIEWNDITVDVDGAYTLTFRYANGRSAGRQSTLFVNGQNVAELPFGGTGAWTSWGTNEITVPLQKGTNTIKVLASTAAGGPNLDHVTVALDSADDDTTTPTIEMSKATYGVNETIYVYFENLPGYATDWVGLYEDGAAQVDYLDYVYSDGALSGVMEFAGRSAGEYEARLFFNDSYNLENSISFTVK